MKSKEEEIDEKVKVEEQSQLEQPVEDGTKQDKKWERKPIWHIE